MSAAAVGSERASLWGSSWDAVFVGSGINALVGAALLARRGWRVAVVEREERLGGAIRTVVTEAGFATETMSCFHTQFVNSPGYQALREDLESAGLRYANTTSPIAVVTDEGDSFILSTDHASNVARLNARRTGEGERWDAFVGRFLGDAGDLLGVTRVYPWNRRGLGWAWGLYRRRKTAGSLALLSELLASARSWLSTTFQDPLTRALLAPWALHGSSGPDDPGSAPIVRAIGAFSEVAGSPVPVGGGEALVRALVAVIEGHGGICATGIDVDRIVTRRGVAVGVAVGEHEISARHAVICSVTPKQLYGRLLGEDAVPAELRRGAQEVRPGPAVMQILYSLDRVLEWTSDPELKNVAIVNVSGGLDAVSRAANECRRGLLPAEPTICVGQPMSVDPTRGPEGTSQLWVQLLETPSEPTGDALGQIAADGQWTEDVREAYADRVQARLAAHLPGLDDSIIERIVLSPADFEAQNINLIGGSSTAGAQDIDQMLVFRPSPYALAPRTPIRQLFHIGAATHPGGSLAAVSGYLVAEMLPNRPRR